MVKGDFSHQIGQTTSADLLAHVSSVIGVAALPQLHQTFTPEAIGPPNDFRHILRTRGAATPTRPTVCDYCGNVSSCA